MIRHGDNEFRVLDFHTHFAGNTWFFDPTISRIFERVAPHQSFNQRNVGRDPGVLIEYLDNSGIDIVCILAEEGPPTNYSVDSGFVIGYARQAPDRIIPIGNINPEIETSVRRRTQNLITAGMRAVKLYCADHCLSPTDRRLRPMYDLCAEHRIPVMFHTGVRSRYYMARAEFGDPAAFEPLFRDYPEIPFVLAHGGKGGREKECFDLLHRYPNTFIEISDVPKQLLQWMCVEATSQRIVFGTDMPQFPSYQPLVQAVLDLPISAAAKQRVFFDNAAEILGLPVSAHQPAPACCVSAAKE